MRRLITFLFCLCLAKDITAGNGSWTSNGPWGGGINNIQLHPGNPFALYVASTGGLFRTFDGGLSWSRSERGMIGSATRAFAIDSDAPAILYAFDSIGLLYRSIDGGDNWLPTGYRTPSPLFAMRIVDVPGNVGEVMILLSANVPGNFPSSEVMVRRSNDAGATFSAVAGIPGGRPFLDLRFDPANPSLVLAGSEALFPVPAPSISPDILFRSSDGGLNFVPVFAPSTNPGFVPAITGLAFAPGSRIYASSDWLGLLRSEDNGLTWSELGGDIWRLLADPINADIVYATRSNGVAVSTDAGLTWTNRNNGLHANGNFLDPATSLPIPAQVTELAATSDFPSAGSKLWAATSGGGVFRSQDLGLNWSNAGLNDGLGAVGVRAVVVHPNPSTIGTGGAGRRIFAGNWDSYYTTPGIFASANGGQTWAPSNTDLNAPTVRSIAIDPLRAGTTAGDLTSSYLYAGGTSSSGSPRARSGGLFRSITGGLSWQRIDGDLPRRGTPPNDYVWIDKVRDLQLDPRSCTVPLAPVACTSGTLKRLYATATGHRTSAGGGVQNYSFRVMRTDNADELGYHPILQTPAVHWIDLSGDLTPSYVTSVLRHMLTPVNLRISPSDPDLIYIGTYKDFEDLDSNDATVLDDVPTGVFKSNNGGINWVPVNNGLPRVAGFSNVVYDVLSLEMHPSNHNILWASVIDFDVPNSASIYKTTDGGASWTESANGIAARVDIRDILVDPGDPDIVYASGAGTASNPGSVYRSDDGGVNWRSIGIGLPADSPLALALDPFNASVLHAGTNTGVWSLTQVPDGDGDGIPDSEENNVLNGDGNGDGFQDALQRDVGSTGVIFRGGHQATNTGQMTSDIRTELS
ncbi:MAG: hypothetical protein HYV17_04960, partial [Xanthomonadales bacterium]|nr:hypothetical protein [Xanthomonadales bacterium]